MMRVVVFVPLGDIPTGGIEALYQLTDSARRCGTDAVLAAPPGTDVAPCPSDYLEYDAPRIEFADVRAEDILVVPEVWIGRKELMRHDRVIVWWLSVEGAFGMGFPTITRHSSPKRIAWFLRATVSTHLLRYRLMKEVVPMPNVTHVTQSHYAAAFLRSYDLSSFMLTDYVSPLFAANVPEESLAARRPYTIAFNPRKGAEFSLTLMNGWDEEVFKPLVGLDRRGVSQALLDSEIYLDLGKHPGRDRIPREAALARCVVVVANRGSAGNDIDMPIPEQYMVNLPKSRSSISELRAFLKQLRQDLPAHRQAQDSYREIIGQQEEQFHLEVAQLMKRLDR